MRELLLAAEVAQLPGQVEGLLLVDEREEERQVGGGLDEVQFVHAVLDVRGQVEAADEVDPLALALEHLAISKATAPPYEYPATAYGPCGCLARIAST